MSRLMYREPEVDDTICAGCGRKLPEQVAPFSWADNGWHHVGCALRFGGALDVRGTVPVTELARIAVGPPVARGNSGPGFEEEVIRDWRAKVAARPGAMLVLRKLRGENDAHVPRPHVWSWRVYLASETGAFAESCIAFRFTRRVDEEDEEDEISADACADCERSYGPGARCQCHDAAEADDPEDDDLKCLDCDRMGPRCMCGDEPVDFHE